VDLREIGAGQLIQRSAHVKLRIARHLAAMFGLRERRVRHQLANVQPRHRTFDFRAAFFDTALIKIVEGKRLLERKHVFGLVIANQGTADGFQAILAAHIAHRCQRIWIAFTGDNGTDDPHARDAGDRGDDVMELNVHER